MCRKVSEGVGEGLKWLGLRYTVYMHETVKEYTDILKD